MQPKCSVPPPLNSDPPSGPLRSLLLRYCLQAVGEGMCLQVLPKSGSGRGRRHATRTCPMEAATTRW